MQYVDFRNVIRDELRKNPPGLTWAQLKERLDLPYERPCQTWINRMEQEIGLTRSRGTGRAFVWKLRRITNDRNKSYEPEPGSQDEGGSGQ